MARRESKTGGTATGGTAAKPAAPPVTLAQVARAAGVSLTTASQALSGKERVAERTRVHVRSVADRLGYQANPLARALARGLSEQQIAVISHGLDLGVQTQRLQVVQYRLRDAGYIPATFIYSAPYEQVAMVESVCRQRPRAILCDFGAAQGDVAPEAAALLAEYQRTGGTLLSYSAPQPALDCDQVFLDRDATYRVGLGHLIDAGHTRLGIRYHGALHEGRHAAAAAYVAGRGLAFLPGWVRWEGVYEEGGARLAERFLAAPPAERPTGILIVNDVSAAAFVAVLARHGLRVPDDVSVVGYDDTPAARYALTPLTTVGTRAKDIADAATEMLQERLSGEYDGPPRRMVLDPPLVERESVAAPPDAR
jgi:DNA-binding LacI/PurR family transcriptional regulator